MNLYNGSKVYKINNLDNLILCDIVVKNFAFKESFHLDVINTALIEIFYQYILTFHTPFLNKVLERLWNKRNAF